jgi:hypothetical protein
MPARAGALAREQRELVIAANNSYLLAFDNVIMSLVYLTGSPTLMAGSRQGAASPCGSSTQTPLQPALVALISTSNSAGRLAPGALEVICVQ